MEVTLTFIKDELGSSLSGFLKREELLSLSVCTAALILGIPHVTKVQKEKSNFVRPTKDLSVNNSWMQMLMFLFTGRHLYISADGHLHCCAVSCLPGLL